MVCFVIPILSLLLFIQSLSKLLFTWYIIRVSFAHTLFTNRPRGEDPDAGTDDKGIKEAGGMGRRKKKRFISKAFIDSSDDGNGSEEERVLKEKREEDRECEEVHGEADEERMQDATVTSTGSSSSDRSG